MLRGNISVESDKRERRSSLCETGKKSFRTFCLFTFFTIRAVHIKISHLLHSDAFNNAIKRFMSRRRNPKYIYNYNGTNFNGGERELCENLVQFNEQKI
ncbi:hypothetical protein HOLleu_26905 [Holothuria leucospilota]|uniref:Uncharacterized protein n=1 Tax=Holothuria leucospilota TaxID=206669 RepID=A0A9Q1BPZ1_HOLLE|nr:hypothetical protein HOLleu_26905 [Holothuria leucospilota]